MKDQESMKITKLFQTQLLHKNNTNLNRNQQEPEVAESVNLCRLTFLT